MRWCDYDCRRCFTHGKDDEEHDRCLHKLREVAHAHSILFNGGNFAVKQAYVTFFAYVYHKDGANCDPTKASAVHNMPPPEKPTQLQRFLRIVTY